MLRMFRFVDYFIRNEKMLYFVICKYIDLGGEFWTMGQAKWPI